MYSIFETITVQKAILSVKAFIETEGKIVEDSRIVDLYLERNEDAIHFTSEKYGGRLRLLARHICGNDQTAEECENDTYYHAWNSIPPHKPYSYLFVFLSKITRALAFNQIRRNTRLKRNAVLVELQDEIEQSLASGNDVETEIDGKLLSMAVSNYLWKQSEEKRKIFIRRYWYMDSISEISIRFAVSEGKVKTVLFRMRRELKDYLENEGFFL